MFAYPIQTLKTSSKPINVQAGIANFGLQAYAKSTQLQQVMISHYKGSEPARFYVEFTAFKI